MNQLFDKMCEYLRPSLVVLIIVLVILPLNLNVHTDEDTPIIVNPPIPPPQPLQPPEVGLILLYGRCEVDYTEKELGAAIWELIEEHFADDVEHLFGLEHHDVFINPPVEENFNITDPSTWNPPVPKSDEYKVRGFYASLSDLASWKAKINAWRNDKEVVYVKGGMIDKVRKKEICTVWGAGNIRNISDDAIWVLTSYGEEWEKFHIVKQNCQHWAFWVLTSEDLNEVENPENFVPTE